MKLLLFLVAAAWAQHSDTQNAELKPNLGFTECSKAGGCKTSTKKVVIDANWRWVHNVGGYTNCYTGNTWDSHYCPDPVTCAQNCAVDGADYAATYGITSNGNDLTLKFVTHGQYSDNVGSRTFLMDTDTTYKTFNLLNREFTFDVDVSNLPCGLNGALYFVEMDADGGLSKYSGNKAGAKFGTGYCDAQCPHDIKWINGEANMLDWSPSGSDKNAGFGKYGTCCVEMDIWEANKVSNAYTAHPCSLDKVKGQTRCDGTDCGDNASGDRYNGLCDKDGCDLNPYRLGSENFFGEGSAFMVDSSKRFTVVTQFITDDGTDTGNLKEIKRFYMQNGERIDTPTFNIGGSQFDSITQGMCSVTKGYFNDTDSFDMNGGLKAMGEALARGSMVLVMSMWDDHEDQMLWLDSCDGDGDPTQPGVCRGSCPTSSGVPDEMEKQYPDSTVVYGNIKFGEIGSTHPGEGPTPGPGPTPSPSGGCCSWDGKSCPTTSDYCEQEDHCEQNCGGQWIKPGMNRKSDCPQETLAECVHECIKEFPTAGELLKHCSLACVEYCK